MGPDRPVLRISALLLALPLALVACTGDDGPPKGPTTALPTSVPSPSSSGSLLCDMMREDSASLAVGGVAVDTKGYLQRDFNGLDVTGMCRVFRADETFWSIEATANSEEPTATAQIKAAVTAGKGLLRFPAGGPVTGYVEKLTTGEGDDADEGARARAVVDSDRTVVVVDILHPGQGRDPVADAAALTQQIAQAIVDGHQPPQATFQPTP